MHVLEVGLFSPAGRINPPKDVGAVARVQAPCGTQRLFSRKPGLTLSEECAAFVSIVLPRSACLVSKYGFEGKQP